MPLHVRKACPEDGSGDLLQKGVEYGAWTAVDDNGPICVWGEWKESILDDVIFVWMEPLRPLEGLELKFLRASRRFVDSLKPKARMLVGTCARDNHVSYRWLFWLGFRPTGTFDVKGRKFIRMELDCGR